MINWMWISFSSLLKVFFIYTRYFAMKSLQSIQEIEMVSVDEIRYQFVWIGLELVAELFISFLIISKASCSFCIVQNETGWGMYTQQWTKKRMKCWVKGGSRSMNWWWEKHSEDMRNTQQKNEIHEQKFPQPAEVEYLLRKSRFSPSLVMREISQHSDGRKKNFFIIFFAFVFAFS